VAGDVLDRLLASTLARLGSDGGVPDTLLDRLMQRELELLHSIWDGRRVMMTDAHGSARAKSSVRRRSACPMLQQNGLEAQSARPCFGRRACVA